MNDILILYKENDRLFLTEKPKFKDHYDEIWELKSPTVDVTDFEYFKKYLNELKNGESEKIF